MDKFQPKDLNKMKVVDLRKFVSQNNIFKGGLSSMKKSDILDGIYRSDFWQNQLSNIQKEQIENRLKQLQEKLVKEQHPVVEEQKVEEEHPVVEEQKVEEQHPVVEEQKVEPVEEQPVESVEQTQDIQKLIDNALQQQKEEMMKRLFG